MYLEYSYSKYCNLQLIGQLQGTIFRSSLVQGTIFHSALVQGTIFHSALVQGTIFRSALVQGTILIVPACFDSARMLYGGSILIVQ